MAALQAKLILITRQLKLQIKVLYLMQDLLIKAYSDSTEGMKHWFGQLIVVTALLGWPTFSINAALVGLKSVGRINRLLQIDLIFP